MWGSRERGNVAAPQAFESEQAASGSQRARQGRSNAAQPVQPQQHQSRSGFGLRNGWKKMFGPSRPSRMDTEQVIRQQLEQNSLPPSLVQEVHNIHNTARPNGRNTKMFIVPVEDDAYGADTDDQFQKEIEQAMQESLRYSTPPQNAPVAAPPPPDATLFFFRHRHLPCDQRIDNTFYALFGEFPEAAEKGVLPSLHQLRRCRPGIEGREVVCISLPDDPRLQQFLNETRSAMEALRKDDVIARAALCVRAVSQRLGGSKSDVALRPEYASTSLAMQFAKHSPVVPLGDLKVGLSRHRAILAKLALQTVGILSSCTPSREDHDVLRLNVKHAGNLVELDIMESPGYLSDASQPVAPASDGNNDSLMAAASIAEPSAYMPDRGAPRDGRSAANEHDERAGSSVNAHMDLNRVPSHFSNSAVNPFATPVPPVPVMHVSRWPFTDASLLQSALELRANTHERSRINSSNYDTSRRASASKSSTTPRRQGSDRSSQALDTITVAPSIMSSYGDRAGEHASQLALSGFGDQLESRYSMTQYEMRRLEGAYRNGSDGENAIMGRSGNNSSTEAGRLLVHVRPRSVATGLVLQGYDSEAQAPVAKRDSQQPEGSRGVAAALASPFGDDDDGAANAGFGSMFGGVPRASDALSHYGNDKSARQSAVDAHASVGKPSDRGSFPAWSPHFLAGFDGRDGNGAAAVREQSTVSSGMWPRNSKDSATRKVPSASAPRSARLVSAFGESNSEESPSRSPEASQTRAPAPSQAPNLMSAFGGDESSDDDDAGPRFRPPPDTVVRREGSGRSEAQGAPSSSTRNTTAATGANLKSPFDDDDDSDDVAAVHRRSVNRGSTHATSIRGGASSGAPSSQAAPRVPGLMSAFGDDSSDDGAGPVFRRPDDVESHQGSGHGARAPLQASAQRREGSHQRSRSSAQQAGSAGATAGQNVRHVITSAFDADDDNSDSESGQWVRNKRSSSQASRQRRQHRRNGSRGSTHSTSMSSQQRFDSQFTAGSTPRVAHREVPDAPKPRHASGSPPDSRHQPTKILDVDAADTTASTRPRDLHDAGESMEFGEGSSAFASQVLSTSPTSTEQGLSRMTGPRSMLAAQSLSMLESRFRMWIQPADIVMTDEVIGRGCYGQVMLAKFRTERCAVKQIMCETTEEYTASMREMLLMQELQFDKIVRFFGAIKRSKRCIWICMEYMPFSDLRKILHSPKHRQEVRFPDSLLTLQRRVKWAKDVVAALDLLHSRNVVHRDLKPGNILISNRFDAVLSDFGLSRGLAQQSRLQASGPGTVSYAAPEALLSNEVSPASDMFSFGCVLWELLSLREPWAELGGAAYQVMSKVIHEKATLSVSAINPSIRERMPTVIAAVRKCFSYDPRHRPTAFEMHGVLEEFIESGAAG